MLLAMLRTAALSALAVFVSLGALADCPPTERETGTVSAWQSGKVQIERGLSLRDASIGSSICTGDRIVVTEGNVGISLKCTGEEWIRAGRDRYIPLRKDYLQACLLVSFSKFLQAEKRDASARAVTLNPSLFRFRVPGLETGEAQMAKVPRKLRVPVSISADPKDVTANLISPAGKVISGKLAKRIDGEVLEFSIPRSAEGTWRLEVAVGYDAFFGQFLAAPYTPYADGKRSETLLREMCIDPAKVSLWAYNASKEEDAGAISELSSYWAAAGSSSLCSPD